MCSRMALSKGIQRWAQPFVVACAILQSFRAFEICSRQCVLGTAEERAPLIIYPCMAGPAAAACSARGRAHIVHRPARHGKE